MNDYEAAIVALLAAALGFVWWLAFRTDATAPLHTPGAIVGAVAVVVALTALVRWWPRITGRR
jgi:hypothetical protein